MSMMRSHCSSVGGNGHSLTIVCESVRSSSSSERGPSAAPPMP